MTVDDNLLWAAIESDDAFREELKRVLDEELYMSARDFARAAGLGESTFYKMLSGGRRPNLTSLRRVILAVVDSSARLRCPLICVLTFSRIPSRRWLRRALRNSARIKS